MSDWIIGISQFIFLWFTLNSLIDIYNRDRPIFRLIICLPNFIASVGMTIGLLIAHSWFGAYCSSVMSIVWGIHTILEVRYVREDRGVLR